MFFCTQKVFNFLRTYILWFTFLIMASVFCWNFKVVSKIVPRYLYCYPFNFFSVKYTGFTFEAFFLKSITISFVLLMFSCNSVFLHHSKNSLWSLLSSHSALVNKDRKTVISIFNYMTVILSAATFICIKYKKKNRRQFASLRRFNMTLSIKPNRDLHQIHIQVSLLKW